MDKNTIMVTMVDADIEPGQRPSYVSSGRNESRFGAQTPDLISQSKIDLRMEDFRKNQNRSPMNFGSTQKSTQMYTHT